MSNYKICNSSFYSYFINTSYVVSKVENPFDQPFLPLREVLSAIYASSNGSYDVEMELIFKDLFFPSILFFIIFMFICEFLRTNIIRQLSKKVFKGIKSKGRFVRFVHQLRLAFFYLTSTIVGYYLINDQPWFQFPLSHSGTVNLYYPHKPARNPRVLLYYQYELGFYLAELIDLFIEPRRSDFYEYVIHHVMTIILMLSSYSIYEFRTGAYILFLHDFTDFFLCAAKVFYYIGLPEYVTNCSFGGFVSTFIYFRLYCLPKYSYQTLTLIPCIRSSISYSFWYVFLTLAIILQCLHFFWFYLIVRVIVRLCLGIKGDVRSDEDIEEDRVVNKKNKDRLEKKKMTDNLNTKNDIINNKANDKINKLKKNSEDEISDTCSPYSPASVISSFRNDKNKDNIQEFNVNNLEYKTKKLQ